MSISNYTAFEVLIDNDDGTTTPVPIQTVHVYDATNGADLTDVMTDSAGVVAAGSLPIDPGSLVRFYFVNLEGVCGYSEIFTTDGGVIVPAWQVLTSDSFDRANGPMNGSALDNALGGTEANTWTVKAGTNWLIQSNRAVNTDPGADELIVVDSTAAIDRQKVSIINHNFDSGVVARQGGGGLGNFYLYYRNTSNVGRLLKYTGGSFSLLGGGSTINNGDTMLLECDGANITAYKNGVADIGPIVDSAIVSGKPGLYAGSNGAAQFDNFKFEIFA